MSDNAFNFPTPTSSPFPRRVESKRSLVRVRPSFIWTWLFLPCRKSPKTYAYYYEWVIMIRWKNVIINLPWYPYFLCRFPNTPRGSGPFFSYPSPSGKDALWPWYVQFDSWNRAWYCLAHRILLHVLLNLTTFYYSSLCPYCSPPTAHRHAISPVLYGID